MRVCVCAYVSRGESGYKRVTNGRVVLPKGEREREREKDIQTLQIYCAHFHSIHHSVERERRENTKGLEPAKSTHTHNFTDLF